MDFTRFSVRINPRRNFTSRRIRARQGKVLLSAMVQALGERPHPVKAANATVL
jgi:hypothetical protein